MVEVRTDFTAAEKNMMVISKEATKGLEITGSYSQLAGYNTCMVHPINYLCNKVFC